MIQPSNSKSIICMKDHKPNFADMLCPVVILLAVSAWFTLNTDAENSTPETHPQGSPDRHKVKRSALLEARLKLLEELKKGDENYILKVPIEFYGKVLDQHDKPVTGAKIEIRLNSFNGITNHDTYTGGDGTFINPAIKY